MALQQDFKAEFGRRRVAEKHVNDAAQLVERSAERQAADAALKAPVAAHGHSEMPAAAVLNNHLIVFAPWRGRRMAAGGERCPKHEQHAAESR